jgi:hypothetical protein
MCSEEKNLCTKCGDDNEGAALWDISDREKLCQMCWEQHCGDAFWEFFGSVDDVAIAIGLTEEDAN